MIEITGLNKTFPGTGRSGSVRALEGVNLEIADHEFVTVLGPSGCGKTTLLRCIAGLSKWDSGDISIDGTAVTGPGSERAMVFQGIGLLPWASILRNVTFGLELRGMSRERAKPIARELLDLVGLDGFADRMPAELSGGMQQRVGLARALAVEPDVLLMDEPFGALDEQTRRLLQREFLQIWEDRRVTVVFITHSMDEALLLGDRVVLMSARPGRIESIIPLDFPRPRSSCIDEIERSPGFHDVKAELWSSLKKWQVDIGTGVKAASLYPEKADYRGR